MICPHCKANVKVQGKFCPRCGEQIFGLPVKKEAQQTQTALPPQTVSQPPPLTRPEVPPPPPPPQPTPQTLPPGVVIQPPVSAPQQVNVYQTYQQAPARGGSTGTGIAIGVVGCLLAPVLLPMLFLALLFGITFVAYFAPALIGAVASILIWRSQTMTVPDKKTWIAVTMACGVGLTLVWIIYIYAINRTPAVAPPPPSAGYW